MKKQETVNTFSDGLILDLNPLSMPNTAVTNCLNGTLRTYNGNENMLQNDMGNARVETAMLPTGYIPLGSTSFGGIIYIVSYNPVEKKCQIGSFPSPERNLSKDELGDESQTTINLNLFTDENGFNGFSPANIITNYYQKVNLLKTPIYPGDKYKIFSNNLNSFTDANTDLEYVSAYYNNEDNEDNNYDINLYPHYLKISVISTLNDGKIIDLTNNSVWTTSPNGGKPFYIYLEGLGQSEEGKLDLDEYRGLVGSNYDTYVAKSSGQLGILAKLEVPTSFSVGYDVLIDDPKQNVENESSKPVLSSRLREKNIDFYFYLNWANDNEGDHKNRVNPQGVIYEMPKVVENDEIIYKDKDKDENNLTQFFFCSYDIKLKATNSKPEETVSPDSLEDRDYYSLKVPDNFYTEEGLEKYLSGKKNEFDDKVFRQNDGTDFQYLMPGFRIRRYPTKIATESPLGFGYKVKSDMNDENGNWTEITLRDGHILPLTITPKMPFGRLKFLERTLQIDLDRLQSGDIDFLNYQYYVDNDEINIEYQIDAYPELGKRLLSGSIEFHELAENLNEQENNPWLNQVTYDSESNTDYLKGKTPIDSYTLPSPLSGTGHLIINKKNSQLVKNRIYIAKFVLKYGSNPDKTTERIFYRLFFNSPIFNNAYGTGPDFKDLYLYESDKDYGIKPSLSFTNSTSSTYDDSFVTNFKKYQEERKTEEIVKEYKVQHSINSTFELSTGLDKELTMQAKSLALAEGDSLSVESVTPENVTVLGEKENANVVLDAENRTLELDNKFSVKIPYTVYYNKASSARVYELTPLKEGAIGHKVIIQHRALNREEGALTVFINPTNKINTEDELKITLECSDQGKGIGFSSTSIESALKSIMNDFEYDYMTVIFGIVKMGDNNCGYGFKNFDSEGYEYFYKLNKTPENYFAKITCLRRNDTVVLVHATNMHLANLANDEIWGPNVNDKPYSFRSYGNLISKEKLTDGTIIPTIIEFEKTQVKPIWKDKYTSKYKKYTKTDDLKPLYYIDNIDFEPDPSIDVNYSFKLGIASPTIEVNTKPITLPEEEGEFVKNLFMKNLENFNTSVTINTTINNKDFVNTAQMQDFNQAGWDKNTNTLIPSDKINKVFNEENKAINELVVNNNLVEMSNDLSSKIVQTQWYFGWEDTGGDTSSNRQRQISYDDFKKSGQWYKLFCTYSSPLLTADNSNNFVLEYDLICDITEFVKGQTYEVKIIRPNFEDGNNKEEKHIHVTCEGGTVAEKTFTDAMDETFETTIHVTPTAETCTITLKLDNGEEEEKRDVVGTWTCETVKDSEEIITNDEID